MMQNRQLLYAIFLLFSTCCYAQIDFEPGYYIGNDNQRVDCFIKNMDWKNNPLEFEYKISESDEVKTNSIEEVKEFAVLNTSHKYYRHTMEVDRSIESTNGLSNNPDFNLMEEKLFLRPLVEGKASLYVYEDRGIFKFFYNLDNKKVGQLFYKRFKTNDNRIGENNQYQQQLLRNLKCKDISLNSIQNIVYRKQALVKFFTNYNECQNSDFTVVEIKGDRNWFNLAIRPGINKSSLAIDNSVSGLRDSDFGKQSNYRLGFEFEFIMPFKGNKLSVIIEPTYQYFEAGNQIASIDYKSMEIPLGIRYYMFLDKKSKLFVNASYLFDFDMD
ncbi:MAG: tRNA modification GTPase, partial [Cyclobacteriaceae bacterium]